MDEEVRRHAHVGKRLVCSPVRLCQLPEHRRPGGRGPAHGKGTAQSAARQPGRRCPRCPGLDRLGHGERKDQGCRSGKSAGRRGLEREVSEGQDHRAVLCLNERRHERKSCAQVHGKGLRESLRAQGRLG